MMALLIMLLADAGLAAAPVTAPPAPTGPPPTVEMQCAPTPVKVGQILACTLEITHRNTVSITVTAPPAFKTLPATAAVPGDGGLLTTTRVLEFQPMEPKRRVKVDGLAIIWHESTGGEGRLEVPGQVVPIQSVLIGAADPQFHTYEAPDGDAKAFWTTHGPVPYRVRNWPLIIGLIVLAGGLLGAGIGFAVKRILDRREKVEVPWVDPRPAHIIALEGLDTLSQKLDLDVKEYYSELSEIIRDYLERRYQFTALEMTSDEILHQVDSMDLKHDARMAILRFLEETDMVKFAAYRPATGEQDTVMLAARGLIQITHLPEGTPESEETPA